MAGATAMSPSGTPRWTTNNYDSIAREGYNANAYVYTCVKKIAENVASSANWYLMDGDEELESHAVLDLLSRPNPEMGGKSFVQTFISYYLLGGDSYVMGNFPGTQVPTELYVLNPTIVKIVKGTGVSSVVGYDVKLEDKSEARIDPAFMLHIKTFNPVDYYYGMPPALAAAHAIDSVNAAKDWNVALLQNDTRLSGAWISKQPLTEAQFSELEKALQSFAGSKGAGMAPVLSGEFEWQQIGTTPEDMDWLEGINMNAREICAVYGVPCQMVGIPDSQTYSNYQEARRAFYLETVIPLLNMLRDELNNWLVRRYGDSLKLDYDRDQIEALKTDNTTQYAAMQNVTFLSVNEKRAMFGFDEVPNGDAVPDAEEPEPVPEQLRPFVGQDNQPAPEKPQEETPDEEQPQNGAKSLETKAMRAHASINKRRNSWTKKVQRLVKEQFDDERKSILLAYRRHGDVDEALQAIEDDKEEWQKLFAAVYYSVGEDFARKVLQSLKNRKDIPADEIKANVFTDTMMDYLSRHAAKQVVGVLDTTKQQIRDAVSAGVEAEEGIDVIAKRIDQLFLEQIIPNRSEVIARTESLSAGNIASDAAARASGVKVQKEWLTAIDGRERPEHAAVNGQVKELDEPFEVGGEYMQYCMDGSMGASAENIIQCRCTILYTRA